MTSISEQVKHIRLPSSLVFGEVLITPDLARQWLTRSNGNRRLDLSTVGRYASEMSGNRWAVNGESIIFDNDGYLTNGHHRLNACIQIGQPFKTTVICGVAPETKEVTDIGKVRTMADILSMRSVSNATIVAAAARLVLSYRAKCLADSSMIASTATKTTINGEVRRHQSEYEKAAAFCSLALSQNIKFNRSAATAFVILCHEKGYQPEEWLEAAGTGIDLQKGDARLPLRSWALNARRMAGADHLAAFIRAWNAHTSNTPRTLIKSWIRTEPFPEIA